MMMCRIEEKSGASAKLPVCAQGDSKTRFVSRACLIGGDETSGILLRVGMRNAEGGGCNFARARQANQRLHVRQRIRPQNETLGGENL